MAHLCVDARMDSQEDRGTDRGTDREVLTEGQRETNRQRQTVCISSVSELPARFGVIYGKPGWVFLSTQVGVHLLSLSPSPPLSLPTSPSDFHCFLVNNGLPIPKAVAQWLPEG